MYVSKIIQKYIKLCMHVKIQIYTWFVSLNVTFCTAVRWNVFKKSCRPVHPVIYKAANIM